MPPFLAFNSMAFLGQVGWVDFLEGSLQANTLPAIYDDLTDPSLAQFVFCPLNESHVETKYCGSRP